LSNIYGVNFGCLSQGTDFRHEAAGLDLDGVVEDDDGAHFLEGPDAGVDFGVFDGEELAVYRVVYEEVHVFALGFGDAGLRQLFIDCVDTEFDVLEVLLLERLILEQCITTVVAEFDSQSI